MAVSVSNTEKLREEIAGLDPDHNPDDRAAYEKARAEYIGENEDARNPEGTPKVYRDTEGNLTVGVGFNLDDPNARAEWDQAFNKLPPEERPDFDKVRNGQEMNETQMRVLFDHSANEREDRLRDQTYGQEAWGKLTPNERLAIEDANYNSGVKPSGPNRGENVLVGKGTKFHENMDKAQDAKNKGDIEAAKKHQDDAIWEIKKNSNRENSIGLQNRRDSEAEMLNTYNRDLSKLQTPDYVVESVRAKIDITFERIKVTDQEARQTANEVSDQNRAEVSRQIKEKCGIEPNFEDEPYLQEEIDGFVQEYKEAVGDMLEDARQDIDARIEEGRQAGETGSAMEKEIASQLERQQEIANRIGERLVHQFDARLTQLRQQAAGIKQYIWRTVGDDRVRASHAAAEGHVFSWDGGGPHPGEEENCRCSAEPVCPE